MKKVRKDAALFLEASARLLDAGYLVRFRAAGGSMRPAIHDGDRLTVAPVDAHTLQAGDVVLFHQHRRPLAHRIAEVRRAGGPGHPLAIVTRGDSKSAPDAPIEPHRIIGKVVHVERSRGSVQTVSGDDLRSASRDGLETIPCRWLAFFLTLLTCWIGGTTRVSAQMVTGTYTGNGVDNTAITQLGFKPSIVIVKGNTAQVAEIRTSTMVGDVTKPLNGATALTANLIQSLDDANGGGFTIGNDAAVNLNTTNPTTSYYFAAFKAAAGKVAVGTYAGTGSAQGITGVGFSPALVVVMDASNQVAVFRTSASTSSCDFNNSACNTTTYITSLDADGFTVGTGNPVNRSGHTYHYAAWKQVSGAFNVGTYVGNGADNRDITGVGFSPEYVWVRAIGARDGVQFPASLGSTTDDTLYFKASPNAHDHIQQLQDDGFQVGTDTDVNASGTTYVWVAWGRSVPTAVRLASFSATRYDAGTFLEWRTGYEVDNLGFHVYREGGGARTRLNPSLIAGSGLLVGGGRPAGAGQAYGWWDPIPVDPKTPVKYWLEDVDFNGTTTVHGPAAPKKGGPTIPSGIQSKLLNRLAKSTTSHPKRSAERGAIRPVTQPLTHLNVAPIDALAPLEDGPTTPTRHDLAVQQNLAAGTAVKLSVASDGWYRVTQPDLVAAGLPANVKADTLRLFADGIEQPIEITGGAPKGRFDASGAVEFYGRGVDTPYTDTRVYWLVWGHGGGRRVGLVKAGKEAAPVVLSFPFTVEHKDRETYFPALQNGEADNFFGELVTTDPTDITLTLARLDPASAFARLEVILQGVTYAGGTPDGHQVAVSVNGCDIGPVTFAGRERASRVFAIPSPCLGEGDNVVTIAAQSGDADVSLVDTIRLTYWHTFVADGDRLRFTVKGPASVAVGGFSTSAIRLVDVTDPDDVVEIAGRVRASQGAYQVSFEARGGGTRTLVAFADPSAWAPTAIRANHPSSWSAGGQAADYVVISPAGFVNALAPLQALRERQGHSVAIVDIEDVYDEFSFGEKTPYALRDFLIRASRAWRKAPRFVVLVGNATIDPRNYLGMEEPDHMPTKIVSTRALETASDDWFVDGNDDGIPDLAAIGRLPVRSEAEAATVVGKIVAYETADAGAWTRAVSFVADASDAEDLDFAGASDRVSQLVPPGYAVSRILRGAVGTGAARTSLINRINEGQALVNYTGHASVQIWRDDLFTSGDVPALVNGTRLPVFVLMDCLNGFFHGLWPEESLAESLVRAGGGGAVAVWASSGFTEPIDQYPLDHAFFQLVFDRRYPTLGEVVAAAKAFARDGDVRRSWIFFGDPATRLKGVLDAASTVPGGKPPEKSAPAQTSAGGEDLPGVPHAPTAAGGGVPVRVPDPVRLQDWDGDGRDDVFLTAGTSWRAVVASGARGGSWDASWDVYPANLDGDAASDAVLFDRATGTWAQALNHGEAGFSLTFGLWGPAWDVQVGDLNGDGLDDVLLSNRVSGLWFQALNDGAGYFTYVPGNWAAGSTTTLGDFNGDGLADALLYNADTGAVSIAYNDGAGRFIETTGSTARGLVVRAVRLAGDHRSDAFFYDRASGAWLECVMPATGPFACTGGTAAPGATLILIAGESGDDELLYNANTGSVTMIVHGAGGRFSVSGVWAPGLAVATGDLDGDGRGDLFLYDASTGVWVRGLARAPGRYEYSSGQWSAGWSLVGRR